MSTISVENGPLLVSDLPPVAAQELDQERAAGRERDRFRESQFRAGKAMRGTQAIRRLSLLSRRPLTG